MGDHTSSSSSSSGTVPKCAKKDMQERPSEVLPSSSRQIHRQEVLRTGKSCQAMRADLSDQEGQLLLQGSCCLHPEGVQAGAKSFLSVGSSDHLQSGSCYRLLTVIFL